MKQNLLDKGTALNLDIVTAELLFVHDHIEMSSSQMMDLVFLYFILIFIFFLIYFLTFYF